MFVVRHAAAVTTAALLAFVLSQPVLAQDEIEPAAAESTVPAAPEPAGALVPSPLTALSIEGPVSYYGREFAGRKTSNGERFDPNLLTMAHRSLPFGTLVRVTNLFNNKSVVVRVNDRGPFTGGRVGDLSSAAAMVIDMLRAGVVRARLEVLSAAHALR